MGVDIFFVISGFLITGILLSEREKVNVDYVTRTRVLRNFVVRRALRIFPIYYLSLAIFWFLQYCEHYQLREHLIYYVTYTSNILFFKQQAWDGYLAPLWSLAVEEQFYLVWPLLMIFMPDRHILKVIIISILIGLVFPYVVPSEMTKVLTPACFSSLGLGALLAWLQVNKKALLLQYRTYLPLALLPGIVILISPASHEVTMAIRVIVSILTFIGIMYCLDYYPSNRVLDWLLTRRQLIFIGKISYGIYLYHNIISIVWRNFFVEALQGLLSFLSPTLFGLLYLIVKFVSLLIMAWLSFRLIEMPFLQIKKYFVTSNSQGV